MTAPTHWRELENSQVVRAFGLTWLEISVRRRAGVSKRTGEARYRLLQSRYLVEVGPESLVKLTTDREGADGRPLAYWVSPHGCTCPHSELNGKRLVCKHRAACYKHGLFLSGFSAAQGPFGASGTTSGGVQ